MSNKKDWLISVDIFVRGCNVRTCFPAIDCYISAQINESRRNKSAEKYNG